MMMGFDYHIHTTLLAATVDPYKFGLDVGGSNQDKDLQRKFECFC